VNAIPFEGIFFVAKIRQEDVKDGYVVHLLQPFIFFIFISYVPTCYAVYVLTYHTLVMGFIYTLIAHYCDNLPIKHAHLC
jgi:hypothetical protein